MSEPASPRPPKPLRLRLELSDAGGKPWLSLLALCGHLRGVVEPDPILLGEPAYPGRAGGLA